MSNTDSRKLLSPTIREKLLKGSAWAFLGKVISISSAVIVNALLARLLTHEEMGAYFLTLSFVSLAAVFAQLGLTQAIVRLISESIGTGRVDRVGQYIYLTLKIATVGGVVVSGLIAFGGGKIIAQCIFHSLLMAQITGIATAWFVLSMFQQLISEIFRGFHDIKLATVFGGVLTGILSMVLFLVLWLVQGHGNLSEVLALTLLAGTTSLIFSSVILWKKLITLPSAHGAVIRSSDILKMSWPLWVTNLTIFGLAQADLVIMGMFRSPEEVAVYGVVTRMIGLVGMPLMIMNAVISPLISEMYSQGEVGVLQRTLRTVSTLGSLPAIMIVGVFVVSGSSLLGVVFGEYYKSGGAILLILCIGQLINTMTGSCGMVLMMTGHQFAMMVITLVSGLLSIVTGCLLVRNYAGEGVAVASAAGLIAQNIAALLLAKAKVGIWTHIDHRVLKRVLAK